MNLTGPSHITLEDYNDLTHNGTLCDDDGALDIQQFDNIMRTCVCEYVQRQAAKVRGGERAGGRRTGVVFVLVETITCVFTFEKSPRSIVVLKRVSTCTKKYLGRDPWRCVVLRHCVET